MAFNGEEEMEPTVSSFNIPRQSEELRKAIEERQRVWRETVVAEPNCPPVVPPVPTSWEIPKHDNDPHGLDRFDSVECQSRFNERVVSDSEVLSSDSDEYDSSSSSSVESSGSSLSAGIHASNSFPSCTETQQNLEESIDSKKNYSLNGERSILHRKCNSFPSFTGTQQNLEESIESKNYSPNTDRPTLERNCFSSRSLRTNRQRLSQHRRSGLSNKLSTYNPSLAWLLDGMVSAKGEDAVMAHFPVDRDVVMGDDLVEYCDIVGYNNRNDIASDHEDDDRSNRKSFCSRFSFSSHTLASESFDCTQFMSSEFMEVGDKKGSRRYVLKRLRKDWYTKKRDAAAALAAETSIMNGLVHSNIAKLRGTVGQPGTGTFGLIIDKRTTLEDRMVVWKQRLTKYRGRFGILGRRFDKLGFLLTERLIVAYGIAKGIKYIHSNNILHLGICPTSISLDAKGHAKIFDFSTSRSDSGRQLFQPIAGKKQYTAPEVLASNMPGAAADVYSFAILFWQIMALAEPFEKYKDDDEKLVVKITSKGKRPPTSKVRSLPKTLFTMIGAAWSGNSSERPGCKEICQLLGATVSERRGMKQDQGDQFAFKMDRSFSFCDLNKNESRVQMGV